jgi:hypothetical protein
MKPPDAPRRIRLALWCLLALAALVASFSWGFVVQEKKLPPYRVALRAYEALRPLYHRLREVVAPYRGRYRAAVWDATGPEGAGGTGLDAEQRREIERLRSLAYLQGSRPAEGRSSGVVLAAEGAWDGLNLVTDGHRPWAALVAMDGRVLHEWSLDYRSAFPHSDLPGDARGSKFWRRVHLLAGGDLLAIYEGSGLVRLDRRSRVVWAFPGWAHHDLDVTADGSIWVLTRRAEVLPRFHEVRPILHDFVVRLDPAGNLLSEVSVLAAIERSPWRAGLRRRMADHGDLLHTNTLEILDGSAGPRLPALRAGNALISMREIDTVAVLDLESESLAWSLSGLWVEQHQPTIVGDGRLLVFDNRGGPEGRSRVLEMDPITQEILWEYGSREGLYSETCGSSQRLPNGNTLITESDNGRAIEVTPAGRIVWEYRTPHRTGEDGELVATLFEVVRLPVAAAAWLDAS